MNTIGWAVKELQDGQRVARSGWNGKDMYLAVQRPEGTGAMTVPYVFLRTAQGDLVPWVCSHCGAWPNAPASSAAGLVCSRF